MVRIYTTQLSKEVLGDYILNEIFKIILRKKVLEELEENKIDYLQVFNIKKLNDNLIVVEHRQEDVEEENIKSFRDIFYLDVIENEIKFEDEKLYIIIENNNYNEIATLMLASEY